ncbi:hypothetical protein E308F_30120 [Moorella sp. E308F]|uniref:hypothetical protein n=1 Tax=Moorella sp. E308F TaxID=2572682 RepID=UPI0010FFAA50|nr:hypothetical protein [Moorella sp. E308F]GEA16766.1 hypothetical protein E308F_30120 [Moorella sp. E308F]
MPADQVAWVEGAAEAENIITALVDSIVSATIPYEINKWQKVFSSDAYIWVTYNENFRDNIQGIYKHTDGNLYPVYKVGTINTISSNNLELCDTDGYVWEVNSNNERTGKKFQVKAVTYVDANGVSHTLQVTGLLLVNVLDSTEPTVGARCYIVEQVRQELDGSYKADPEWNEFKIVAEMPSDWNYLLTRDRVLLYNYYGSYTYLYKPPVYRFTERYYTADINISDKVEVLKITPDPPTGLTAKNFYVMFKHPIGQYNYFDVLYGEGFLGTPSSGDPTLTYKDICDVTTVGKGKTPVIIDQKKAEAMYKQWNDPQQEKVFVPPSFSWEVRYGREVVSPPAHYFYGCNTSVSGIGLVSRRPEYQVNYYLSINNRRIAMIIEGDPVPDREGYYRSFGYIGPIISFSSNDYTNNFAVTVGMGELNKDKTGFVLQDIDQNNNPLYTQYGDYASNGMYSVSMLSTKSGSTLFQAFYPSFNTPLPNYHGGSIPSGLYNLLIAEDFLQASRWTGKFHASPIYLYHQYEGYRGYLDGVLAISPYNLTHLDELEFDTGEPKDPANPEVGNWIEVYKFVRLLSPINFMLRSANPNDMMLAILKEVR